MVSLRLILICPIYEISVGAMRMMKTAKIPRDWVTRITLRVHDSGTESAGVCGGGPPIMQRGSSRAIKTALPDIGIAAGDCARQASSSRFAGVGGLHQRRGIHRVCPGDGARRWSERPDRGAGLPLLLRRPLVLRRRLGYGCDHRIRPRPSRTVPARPGGGGGIGPRR